METPSWLTEPETYEPPADRDRFIDRSILSFMNMLSKIKQQSKHDHDLLWVSPFFKLAGTLLFVILVSLSQHFTFVYIMLAYTAVILACLPGDRIKSVLKGAFAAALLAYVILIPSALTGNNYSITMIPVKVFTSITMINMLSISTRWDHLIASLRRFFVPNMFIFIFDIMIKYVVLLGEYALQMLYALKLRSVGHNKHKYASIGGVGGMLFVKSRAMSAEMFNAMTCRGYDGTYHVTDRFRFTVYDAIYLLLNAGIIFLYIYFQRLV